MSRNSKSGARAQSLASGWYANSPSMSTAAGLCVLVLLATAAMSVAGFGRNTVEALVMLTAVVGLYSYTGVTGIASFGHVAFMAVGGYVATILTLPAVIKGYRLPGLPGFIAQIELNPYVAVLAAVVSASLVAALFGLMVWRLNGLAAGIATLALLLGLYTIASGWESVTGGRGAVPGVPNVDQVWPALIVALLAIVGTVIFTRSKRARFAKAAREDQAAALAIGIHVHPVRWLSMVYSGGLLGAAGALYVFFVGSISPDFFYVPMMFMLLAMLVIGGMTSLTGAVVGTIVFQFLRQVLEPLDSGFSLGPVSFGGHPGLRFVVLGVLMLVVLAKRPGGLVNGYEVKLPWPFFGKSTASGRMVGQVPVAQRDHSTPGRAVADRAALEG